MTRYVRAMAWRLSCWPTTSLTCRSSPPAGCIKDDRFSCKDDRFSCKDDRFSCKDDRPMKDSFWYNECAQPSWR